jgi:hypothetical protein
MKQSKNKLNRTEIIQALRSHAHPTWFHSILSFPTPALSALLEYYRAGGKPKLVEVE